MTHFLESEYLLRQLILLWRLLNGCALSLDKYGVIVTVTFCIHTVVCVFHSPIDFISFYISKILGGGGVWGGEEKAGFAPF